MEENANYFERNVYIEKQTNKQKKNNNKTTETK